jgi:hypothetical protein
LAIPTFLFYFFIPSYILERNEQKTNKITKGNGTVGEDSISLIFLIACSLLLFEATDCGMLISKWMLKKQCKGIWISFIWLRTGSSYGLMQTW